MKAEAPALRQTLIHELVQEFSMRLRTFGFNDRRDDRIPLDHTIAPDDPRPASHHQTHDCDDYTDRPHG